MKLSYLSDNWPKTIAIIALTAILFWGYGCPPKTDSILVDGKKVTMAELQIELDSIIATAEYRVADLKKQQEFRDIIYNNALLMVQGGTLNPVGVATMLAGLYGLTRGGQDLAKKVKKKSNNS